MIPFFKKICQIFSRKRTNIIVKNVKGSTIDVNVYDDSTIVNRPDFEIDIDWFKQLLAVTYDEEIKSKYIPELHQISDFERLELNDVLNFNDWKRIYNERISISSYAINKFKLTYTNFYDILDKESIAITDSGHLFIQNINSLQSFIQEIETNLTKLKGWAGTTGYKILLEKSHLASINHHISNVINLSSIDWNDFLDSEPIDNHILLSVAANYNQVYYELNGLNEMLERLKVNVNHKIIVGNAGTGKTHILAHLINSLKKNGDYVIFFKPKQFNGDDVNLEARLLQLLLVPIGYTLSEILNQLNSFAQSKDKRCFIIIDALNETTKSSIGFSSLWNTHLQSFINHIRSYSHLYFICTLRTSYIDNIWPLRPAGILEIKGFQKKIDIREACQKYFAYYKIKPLNMDTADLGYFRVPLLLDLFCKLTNETQETEKEIQLDVNTYLQIFEDYVGRLISEVKYKLNLQKSKPIIDGLYESSIKFLANNEAVISIDNFSDAFDKDDTVTQDKSIARLVLEGYLIFIKDIVGRNIEIVKHTQQEVGGYLLAKMLCETYKSVEDLLNLQDFKDKIIGNDPSKHHQLRLDILKFLIALRPEIIKSLKDEASLNLSWWYLYNGFDNVDTDIPVYLTNEVNNKFIVDNILDVSSNQWFNPTNNLNFNFISTVLEKLDTWELDERWTFFIYNEAEFFYQFIEDNTDRLKGSTVPSLEYSIVVAKFIAFTLSTNIRELRDLASIYLIEFGKRYPILLLELTENVSKLADSYIYERLASICYGVALNLQNSEQYLNEYLPVIARRLYALQFADNPKAPVYNYIVIDSIKHLLDLALYKNRSDFNETEIRRFSNYEFLAPFIWILPNEEQSNLIDQSSQMSWPEPIGMDFGIYTIPRLMIEDYVNDRGAIANVYKRVFELGYKNLEVDDFTDERFKEFYWGHNIPRYDGKVDRVGKKYSWKAFFDYAGFLLLNKQLNVFEKDDSDKKYYHRLSDVDIDICIPKRDYKLDVRLYQGNLLEQKDIVPEWYKEIRIDSMAPFFEYQISNENYIMLYGKIDQRLNEEYKVRSFILAETFFIKRNDEINNLKRSIVDQIFDWSLGIHFHADRLRNVYFGELYWADNMGENSESNTALIPTGNTVSIKRKVTLQDTFYVDGHRTKDIGKEIEKTYPEKLVFESENTMTEYLWESESKILNGFSEYYPSLKMGKHLGLKAEPNKGKILDASLNECFVCIEHEDGNYFNNTFNYMRGDLLRKYMAENDLVLVYQVKQHSYDINNEHNRGMKFFTLE